VPRKSGQSSLVERDTSFSARRHTCQLKVEYLPVEQIKRNPANPRIHTEKQREQIARSIKQFGFNVPILIDEKRIVVAGHGRLDAAEFLHLTSVPTIQLKHLTDDQRVAFMVADNKLGENSSWDKKLLGEQLKILSEAEIDFSLEDIGFETGAIDILIEGLSSTPEVERDPADALLENDSSPQVTRLGDLWHLGRNRVFCGNSLEKGSYLVLLEKQRAAMVFADPPYNVSIARHATGLGAIQHREFSIAAGEMTEGEFTDFLGQAFAMMVQHSAAGSLHFVCMDWRHIRELLAASRHLYSELKNLCVWVKDNGGMGSLYRSQHELVFVFKNGNEVHSNNVQLGRFGRYRTNVWHYPGMNSFSRSTEEGNLLELHPTVKPVWLIADALLDCSKRGNIVLDPFLGSGTTVIAAERTGRICYGMEIDPLYVDTIVRRWQRFTKLSATHAISGKSFAELEKEVAQ
jgi:DNA modification methylase